MSTRGLDSAAAIAAGSALSRKHRNAVRAQTETLVDEDLAEPEDFARYHMAWLHDQALTGIAPPGLLLARATGDDRSAWPAARPPAGGRGDLAARPSLTGRPRWWDMLAVISAVMATGLVGFGGVFGSVPLATLGVFFLIALTAALMVVVFGAAVPRWAPSVEPSGRDRQLLWASPMRRPTAGGGSSRLSGAASPGGTPRSSFVGLPFDDRGERRRRSGMLGWTAFRVLTAVTNMVILGLASVGGVPRAGGTTTVGAVRRR